mmetsp:Transcript_34944/g.58525  ORF Transcript_34944/g.58525 Transcript_34944/m.58525 type:complete len:251 (+) Transcript_34944:2766-3518(+)
MNCNFVRALFETPSVPHTTHFHTISGEIAEIDVGNMRQLPLPKHISINFHHHLSLLLVNHPNSKPEPNDMKVGRLFFFLCSRISIQQKWFDGHPDSLFVHRNIEESIAANLQWQIFRGTSLVLLSLLIRGKMIDLVELGPKVQPSVWCPICTVAVLRGAFVLTNAHKLALHLVRPFETRSNQSNVNPPWFESPFRRRATRILSVTGVDKMRGHGDSKKSRQTNFIIRQVVLQFDVPMVFTASFFVNRGPI